jgi:hypothetical protein
VSEDRDVDPQIVAAAEAAAKVGTPLSIQRRGDGDLEPCAGAEGACVVDELLDDVRGEDTAALEARARRRPHAGAEQHRAAAFVAAQHGGTVRRTNASRSSSANGLSKTASAPS